MPQCRWVPETKYVAMADEKMVRRSDESIARKVQPVYGAGIYCHLYRCHQWATDVAARDVCCLSLLGIGKMPLDKQENIHHSYKNKPCISPELGGLNASINSTECGLETSALPFAFKRSRSPTEWWCTLVILVTFAWSAVAFAFRVLFCSSESYKRFTFINITPVINPPLSYQCEAQSISTPVHLRQIVFERICNRRQQVGGGEYLHTTLRALVTTWCCVGRQAGLTCVQAVPVKHV